jgi:hypothetical protein
MLTKEQIGEGIGNADAVFVKDGDHFVTETIAVLEKCSKCQLFQ